MAKKAKSTPTAQPKAQWYVYRANGDLRTNVPPDMWELWEGRIGRYIDRCPEGWYIAFNLVSGEPVEVVRRKMEVK